MKKDQFAYLHQRNADLEKWNARLRDAINLVLRGLASGSIKSKPIIITRDLNAAEYPMKSLDEILEQALSKREDKKAA